MKQPTIFDYLSGTKSKGPRKEFNSEIEREILVERNEPLTKTLIQKNLSQVIKEQQEFQSIKDILGDSWYKQEDGFGYTDKENIMVVSLVKDFNINFFTLYDFNDFKRLEKFEVGELKEERNQYFEINDIKYNCFYLSKAFQVLGESYRIYQHTNLKLLYLKNSKLAVLICPRF